MVLIKAILSITLTIFLSSSPLFAQSSGMDFADIFDDIQNKYSGNKGGTSYSQKKDTDNEPLGIQTELGVFGKNLRFQPPGEVAPAFYNNLNKIYRARQLIERKENWLQAAELLRQVLTDKNYMPSSVLSRIKKAKNRLSRTPWRGMWSDVTNARYLVEPYLAARQQLNEALMALRIKLNINSDVEATLVQNLIRSYFFPGIEEDGEIIFPNPREYEYQLFSLTKEFLESSQTTPGNQIRDKRAPKELKDMPIPNIVAALIGSLDKTRSGFGNAVNSVELRQLGISRADAAAIIKIISKYRADEEKSVFYNRYLEWSLLLQAIAEPVSVQYDEQLQSFLKGVRLKLRVGATDEMEGFEYFKELMQSQTVPFDLEYGVADSSTGKRSIYIISTAQSVPILKLRLFMIIAKYLQDFVKVKSTTTTITSFPAVAATGKWLGARFINISQYLASVARKTPSNAGLFHRMVGGVSQILSRLGPRSGKTISKYFSKVVVQSEKLSQKSFFKNGYFLKSLVAISVAADVLVWNAERKATDSYSERRKLYNKYMSRIAANGMYLVPIAGWGAAIADLGHWIFKTPSAANIIEGTTTKALPNLIMIGLHKTGFLKEYHSVQSLEIYDWENTYSINPEHGHTIIGLNLRQNFHQAGDIPEAQFAALEVSRLQIQDYAFKRLLLIYNATMENNNRPNGELGKQEELYLRTYNEMKENLNMTYADLKTKMNVDLFIPEDVPSIEEPPSNEIPKPQQPVIEKPTEDEGDDDEWDWDEWTSEIQDDDGR